jgi:hypothetical protein
MHRVTHIPWAGQRQGGDVPSAGNGTWLKAKDVGREEGEEFL